MRRGLLALAIVAALVALLIFLDPLHGGSGGASQVLPTSSLPSAAIGPADAGTRAPPDPGGLSTEPFFEHELRVRVNEPRGYPLAGATVELRGPTGSRSRTTDGAGVAKFRPPRPGLYEVKAARDGFADAHCSVTVPDEASRELTLGYERVIRGRIGNCPMTSLRVLVHGNAASLDGASGLLEGAGTTREVQIGAEEASRPLWGLEGQAWFEIGNLPLGGRFALTLLHPTHAPRPWEIPDLVVGKRHPRTLDFWTRPLHVARLRFVDSASGSALQPPPQRTITFEPEESGQWWRSRPFLGESWLVASGVATPDPRNLWLIGHCSEASSRSSVRGTIRTALVGFQEVAAPITLRPIDRIGQPQVVALERSSGAALTRIRIVDDAGGEPLVAWTGRVELLTLDREAAAFRATITTDPRGQSLAVALPPRSYLVGGDPALVGGARVRVTPSGGALTLRARRGGGLEVLALDENGDPIRHYVLFLQARHPQGASRPESRRHTIRRADPFLVRHLAPGPWSCTIIAPGYAKQERILDVTAGASASWHARLSP